MGSSGRRVIGITFLVVLAGFVGLINISLPNATGVTYVSGDVYDGAGGPWTVVGSPYIAVGHVTVPVGQILTIDPGVEVRFQSTNLYIDGNLNALGTKSNRIMFTSDDSTPSAGDWGGIHVRPTGHSSIKYCNITYGKNGIYIEASSDNIIANNNIFLNYWNGIYLTDSSNLSISMNNILFNNDDGIHGRYSTDIFITLNNVSLNGQNGVYLRETSSSSIINNNVSRNNVIGVKFFEISGGNSVKYNNISGNGAAMSFYRSSNNNITSNNISNNGYGVSISNTFSNTLINNKFNNGGVTVGGNDLYHFNSHNITVDNIVNGKPLYYYKNCNGVNLDGLPIGQLIIANCTDVKARNLHIKNTDIGIEAAYSSNTTITGCNLLNISRRGIDIQASSDNLITDNFLAESGGGIYFDFGTNNTIVNNTVINNEYGFYLANALSNRIYHNNIIDNTIQASDYESNFWDDSYPSGGNYWSDYSPLCQDLYDGPVTPQTTGSPDLICDDKYQVWSSNFDYYPLKKPFYPVKPATNLSAELTGIAFENVTISWDASLDDPGNVTKYTVYYDTDYEPIGSNYKLLTEVPTSGASRYYITIQGIGDGNPNNYFFYVMANKYNSFTYPKSDTQVAKFVKYFNTPKSLISIPLILNNTNISDTLRTMEFNIAWYYNNSDPLAPWKYYNPSKPINNLRTVNRTMALYINVPNINYLTVAGVVPKVTNIQLKTGWNLVGYPSFIERDVWDALSGVSYERIEGYNPNAIPQNLELLSDFSTMKPGYGYWIKVSSDTTWTVNN